MFAVAKTLKKTHRCEDDLTSFFHKIETPLTWRKLYSHLVVKWENARLKLVAQAA